MASIAELLFRIRADSTGAAAAVAPLTRELDKAEDSAKDLERAVNGVDGKTIDIDVNTRAIAKAQAELARLRESFANDLELGIDVDTKAFTASVAKIRAQIRALTPSKSEREDINPASVSIATRLVDTAQSAGLRFVSTFGKVLQAAGPEIASAAGAVGAVVGGALVTAAGGAILAGVGALGIGAVIASAFQDERIKSAASVVFDDVKLRFAGLSNELLGPVMNLLQTLATGAVGLMDAVQPAIDQLGPTIDTLALGLAGFMDNLGPGLADALLGAQPVLQAIADELPNIATSLGAFLSVLAENGDGAALALKALLIAIELTVNQLTFLTATAMAPFQLMAVAINLTNGELDKMNGKLGTVVQMGAPLVVLGLKLLDTRKSAEEASNGLAGMTEEQRKAAAETEKHAAEQSKLQAELAKTKREAEQTAETLGTVFGDAFSRISGADTSFLGVQEGMLRLSEAFQKGTTDLDDFTQAGIDNQQAILGQVSALARARDASVANGESILAANATYLAGIQNVRNLTREYGFNATAIEELVGRYAQIPAEQITQIKLEMSTTDSPEATRAALVAKFGLGIVQEIETQIDTEKYKAQISGLTAVSEKVAAVTVGVNVDPGQLDTAKGQVQALVDSKPKVPVFVQMDMESYNAAVSALNTMAVRRTVIISPSLDQVAAANVQRGLNNLVPGNSVSGNSTTPQPTPGPTPRGITPNAAPTVNVFLSDGRLVDLIDTEIVDSVTGAASAAHKRVISV